MDSTCQNCPKFSIVIPTYNTTDVLCECINSLSIQSVSKKSFEVIIINDGGESVIQKMVNCYESQLNIKYLHQDHKGPAAARNLGIENAKGEIILFLDDDSVPTRNWLKAVIDRWRKYSDYDGIGGYTLSEVTDSIYCRINSDFFNWYLRIYSDDEFHPFLSTCNAGYKKDILNRVGKFDESFKKAAGEERDLNIKIRRIGGRLKLDEDIIVYHDRDLTFRSFILKHYNYGKSAYSIYRRYPELKHLSSRKYANLYITILGKYKTLNEKVIVFLLLTISQACTAVGYYLTSLFNQKSVE